MCPAAKTVLCSDWMIIHPSAANSINTLQKKLKNPVMINWVNSIILLHVTLNHVNTGFMIHWELHLFGGD